MNLTAGYQLRFWQRLLIAAPLILLALLWHLLPAVGPLYVITRLILLLNALAGAGWLLFYQYRRLTQLSAWIPVFSFPVAIYLCISLAGAISFLILLLLPVTFLLAGLASILRLPGLEQLLHDRPTFLLAFKVALDEAMLGYFVTAAQTPSRQRTSAIAQETLTAIKVMEARGWLDDPVSFHQSPDVPVAVELDEKTARGHRYHALRFASQYQPDPELPGREQWLSYEATHTVRARLFEHQEPGRPWLMCIHGYRMGWPYLDFQLFSPGWLYHKLGFNLIMPLLPLHGHRKIGFRSGDGFFEGDLLNLLHAEGQAQSDLRACIQWLRCHREVRQLGVYGISLGGLNASLLSCLEPDIDSLIAGIPLVDPASVFELNAPGRLIRGFEKQDVTPDTVRQLLKPISPLMMDSQVKPAARAIVAGSYDRILPLAPIQALQTHWGDCQTLWYAGTHLSVRREREVHDWLKRVWASHGMLDLTQMPE